MLRVYVNSYRVACLVVSAGFSQGCGAQTGRDVTVSGTGPGGATNSGGAGAIADAGPLQDAAYCARDVTCRNRCCGCQFLLPVDASTSDIVNCRIELKITPSSPVGASVYIGCDLAPALAYDYDAGLSPNPDSWLIDFTKLPAWLVFGTALCEELRATPNVPIYSFSACSCID